MLNFRTSSLFHYTKLNNLIKILQEGMIPNFCKEEFPTNTSNFVVGIPMVSFCDIPLTRTDIFTGRYGNHAIVFQKNGLSQIMGSIKSLTAAGDTNQSVSDGQKEILISKIISFERIKKDF